MTTDWRKTAREAAVNLTGSAEERISDAHTHIAAAGRATTEAAALQSLALASKANADSDRLLTGAAALDPSAEDEALAEIRNGWHRGLDPTAP